MMMVCVGGFTQLFASESVVFFTLGFLAVVPRQLRGHPKAGSQMKLFSSNCLRPRCNALWVGRWGSRHVHVCHQSRAYAHTEGRNSQRYHVLSPHRLPLLWRAEFAKKIVTYLSSVAMITASLALLSPRSPALASPPAWTASPRIARPAVMLAAPRDDSPSSLFSPESWTEKGFDGIQRLPAACRAAEATTAEAEHLALAFLSQDADSVVARTLSKAGSSAASLKRQFEDFSARQPKVKGAAPEQPSVGASLLALVRGANNERAALGDEFLSGDGAHSFRKPPDPSQTLPAPFPLLATPSPGTPPRSAPPGEHVLIALAEEPRCGRAALRAGGAPRRSVRCGSRRRDLP